MNEPIAIFIAFCLYVLVRRIERLEDGLRELRAKIGTERNGKDAGDGAK